MFGFVVRANAERDEREGDAGKQNILGECFSENKE